MNQRRVFWSVRNGLRRLQPGLVAMVQTAVTT